MKESVFILVAVPQLDCVPAYLPEAVLPVVVSALSVSLNTVVLQIHSWNVFILPAVKSSVDRVLQLLHGCLLFRRVWAVP